MAVSLLLYGIETWTLKKRYWNRIKAATMKYVTTVKGCTRTDQLRNEDIRNELGIFPLYEKITEYRDRRKIYLQRVEQNRILFQAYKYLLCVRQDIGRPRRRWKDT
jgi:hypothetical protein